MAGKSKTQIAETIPPHSTAAVRSALGGPHSSVVAYDAGVRRKNTFDNGTGVNMYNQYVQAISPADTTNAFYAADTALHHPISLTMCIG